MFRGISDTWPSDFSDFLDLPDSDGALDYLTSALFRADLPDLVGLSSYG